MNIFKLWMKAATPGEQETMASLLGTSRNMLYQISGGFKPVSAERGADIERVAADMHTESLGRLPLLYRTDMVDACRRCEFARQCLGNVVDRAIVDSEGGEHD